MRTLAFTLALLCLNAIGHPTSVRAFCRLTTEAPLATGCQLDGAPLEWRRPCIPFSVDHRGSAALNATQAEEVISRSFQAWLDVRCGGENPGFQVRATSFSTCRENEFHVDAGNLNTVAFVDDWLERGYDPAAYALTTTWFSTATGEILDADMQLNEIKGSYVECPAAGCVAGGDDIDLENTVTHELGHFFGLAHSDVPQATMFSTARNGDVDKRDLDDDDVAGFCAAYGAGSLGSSCSFTPPGGLELNCEDPGCGCSVPGARSESQAPIAMSILGVVLMWWRRRR